MPTHWRTVTRPDRAPDLTTKALGCLTSRSNLAAAYQAAGRLDEAIPLLELTLADFEQVLGETHPNTLTSRNNLANVYQAAGRLDEAEGLRRRARGTGAAG